MTLVRDHKIMKNSKRRQLVKPRETNKDILKKTHIRSQMGTNQVKKQIILQIKQEKLKKRSVTRITNLLKRFFLSS